MLNIITLDSGVKLILDKMTSVKSASIGIWCGTGSVNERPDEFGISHFIEHMLFKGTKNRDAFQIVKEMDSLGAEINAFTSKEKTCFYAKCVDDKLFQVADVLVDMIENPLFDQTEMDREKLVVIEEINMTADDPDDVAMDEFDSICLADSGLAHPVLGFKKNIQSFNHDFVAKYYNEHYTKDNVFVSIAGSFDEDEVVKYFQGKFQSIPDKKRNDEFVMPEGKVEQKTIIKDIEQAHICMGLLTVPASDDRRYHLSVLSALFGGGMSSRLFQTIREKKGLAYSVYSTNSFFNKTGEFGIIAGIAKDRVDEFTQAVKEEIELLGREPIKQNEFDTALTQLKSSYIYSLENTMTRMRTNGSNYLAFGYCPDQTDTIKKLDSIKLSDIESTKKLIMNFENYSMVTVTGK